MTRRAVFLDKDGTLVENEPYNVDPARIRLVHRASAAVRALNDAGYVVVLVSNQPGVAKGYFDLRALERVRLRLGALLATEGGRIDDVRWCPHHLEGVVERFAVACGCHKPAPGMLLAAAAELGIDLRSSWGIGDILDDVQAAHRAGCRAVLLDPGGETEWRLTRSRVPDAVAPDLAAAVAWILAVDRAADRLPARRTEVVA